jgi:hypothetical protein
MNDLFPDLTTVGIFLVITLYEFNELFSSGVSALMYHKGYKEWMKDNTDHMNAYVCSAFCLGTIVMTCFHEASFFYFFKHVYLYSPDELWIVPYGVFIFLFNIIATKQFIGLLVEGHGYGWGVFWLLVVLGTDVAYLAMLGFYGKWLEFGLFMVCFIWFLIAVAVTSYSAWDSKKRKKTHKKKDEL